MSIEKFTIKNHAGTAPNSYAGIYAVGGNNNLSIKDCTIKDNVGGCGFYANGPVNGVTLDNLDVSGHTAAFGAARGSLFGMGLNKILALPTAMFTITIVVALSFLMAQHPALP